MARRIISVTPQGISYKPGLRTLEEHINSVPEEDYRDAIANPMDVLDHWNIYKQTKSPQGYKGGPGLTMVSDISPMSNPKSSNHKLSMNASNPNHIIRNSWEMGVALSHADTSGVLDVCGSCRTPQCTALCNGRSGHYAVSPDSKAGGASRAQQLRTNYWADYPQMAGALTVIQARSGAREAQSMGLIPILRANMYQDVDLPNTTLGGPLVHDFNEIAGTRAEGLSSQFHMLEHSNYTKNTMNRALKPGESEPDANYPDNYNVTASASETTPIKRIMQRHAAGGTTHVPFWASSKGEKPSSVTLEDKHGDRGTFPMFNADNMDAVMHNKALGNTGIGAMGLKMVPGMKDIEGKMTPSSFIRPLDPDAPVGSPMGIPEKYASPETKEKLGVVQKPTRKTAPKK